MNENITVSSAPHISKPLSTRIVMIDVIIGLVPAVAAAGYYFRIHAFVLIPTCIISCVLTEWLCNLLRRKPNSLGDFSAVVTGIILALSLPPELPVWAAVIGSVFAIGIGKMVFGGLGANIFNPAMAGRTFLTACFGVLMTTWMVPVTVDTDDYRVSGDNTVNAMTQATPLAWSKEAIKTETEIANVNKQLYATFLGETGGCLGETSALALLIGGLYLVIRRTIALHIPLAVIVSSVVIATVAYLINPSDYVWPVIHLTSGGMLLCAFFIATDPVTAPLTAKGMWIFGIGVGVIIMLIRIVGEYPEGVMFAVLLMNAVTPLIDRFCRTVPMGGKPDE
jgi:electron transport complex protein RnfD